jgi:hypothetical protein
MISMMRKPAALAAALVAIGLLGTPARADLIITVQEDAGAVTTVSHVVGAPGDLIAPGMNTTTTDYAINVLGGEAVQDSLTKLLSSTTSVTRTTDASAGTHVLHIVVLGSGYTTPNTPPNITANSSIGVTAGPQSSTNTLDFQSFVNGTGLGVQTPNIATKLSDNSSITATITSLVGTFDLKQTFDVTLAAKSDTMNYSSNLTLSQIPSTSVPEPSTLALTGLGTLGLVGYGLRRRKARGA